MARSYGLSLEQLMSVLRQSTGTSWVVENWDVVASIWPQLEPLAKKDVDLCVAAAKKNSVAMPILEATAELPWGGAGER